MSRRGDARGRSFLFAFLAEMGSVWAFDNLNRTETENSKIDPIRTGLEKKFLKIPQSTTKTTRSAL